MALGIRGPNPIWSEVDLQGKLFDDTFWLFVLENEIPYVPATVFHDPDLNVPWSNPIQFLGNGTLPVDIYFEADKVYRLEFRQGPTQQDPLIYEVDNYVAGTGGSTPVDTIAFASSNEVTNPQFALFSLQNPSSFNTTDPDPIDIGAGWQLLLSGTGTCTINQVPLNSSNINPSNAPYALRLTMNGWTDVKLRQRFEQNGMLWANKIVSTALTAFITGAPQSVSATLVDSNSSVLATVLPVTSINEAWNEYTGHAQLPATTNPNTPPAAYIDYLLHIPSNIDVYLTSIQLVVQDLPVEPSFEQDSINRQIDHSYNAAYPIVPVGAIIDFGGVAVPEHYYLCDGTAVNRARNYLLFQALTTTDTVTLTNGVNTFLSNNFANYHIGMALEGTGIPAATTITNIVGTTITMSANATDTGPSAVTFFMWGDGDGSTTFNLPDLRGYATAGANGTVLGAGVVNGVGLKGGSSTHTLSLAEMPVHSHGPLAGGLGFRVQVATGGTVDGTSGTVNRYDAGTGNAGSGAAHSIVQPTAMVKKCIRYQ
jgi:microcystin-dependent protein